MAGDCTRQIPRRGFLLSLAATILMMAAASAPSLFYPQIAERLELVPVATTFVFAVYTFTLLAALLYLGPLSDYIGRRPVVTAGSLALALSLAMFWFAGGLGLFAATGDSLVERVTAGVGPVGLPAKDDRSRPGEVRELRTLGAFFAK